MLPKKALIPYTGGGNAVTHLTCSGARRPVFHHLRAGITVHLITHNRVTMLQWTPTLCKLVNCNLLYIAPPLHTLCQFVTQTITLGRQTGKPVIPLIPRLSVTCSKYQKTERGLVVSFPDPSYSTHWRAGNETRGLGMRLTLPYMLSSKHLVQ